jgi:ferredoxin
MEDSRRKGYKYCDDCGECHSSHPVKAFNNLVNQATSLVDKAVALKIPDRPLPEPPKESPIFISDQPPPLMQESDDDEEEDAVSTEPLPDSDPEAEEDVSEEFELDEFTPSVTEFVGSFEDYLGMLAKTSEDDLTCYDRIRECLQNIPSSEFKLQKCGDMDDVTVTDRGLRLLCILLHTPRSVALWNKASECIRTDGHGDLAEVFRALAPLSNSAGKPDLDQKTASLWSRYKFESEDEMIDVVEEAWKTAALGGFKSAEEYEEEKKWIASMRTRTDTPSTRIQLRPQIYESIRQTVKRKPSGSPNSITPDRQPSPTRTQASSSKTEQQKTKQQHKYQTKRLKKKQKKQSKSSTKTP